MTLYLSGQGLASSWKSIVAGLGGNLHPDFGESQEYGIPYLVVEAESGRVVGTVDAVSVMATSSGSP